MPGVSRAGQRNATTAPARTRRTLTARRDPSWPRRWNERAPAGGHPVLGAESVGSGPRLLEEQRPIGTAGDAADDQERHAFAESERGGFVRGRHACGRLLLPCERVPGGGQRRIDLSRGLVRVLLQAGSIRGGEGQNHPMDDTSPGFLVGEQPVCGKARFPFAESEHRAGFGVGDGPVEGRLLGFGAGVRLGVVGLGAAAGADDPAFQYACWCGLFTHPSALAVLHGHDAFGA
jgi:hypothetical protein